MFLLLLWVGLAIGISFVCSLLEAVLLSARRTALVEAHSRGCAGAGLLLRLKQERLDDAIAAILSLNTISHTLGAALA
ncbi:MAG: hemolysin, partial [Planctomycetota bacterium]